MAGIDKYGFPLALEITFINSKLVRNKKIKNLRKYPLDKLDYPSVRRNKDINLIFN